MFSKVALLALAAIVSVATAEPGCLVTSATPCTVLQWRENIQCRILGKASTAAATEEGKNGYVSQAQPGSRDNPVQYGSKVNAMAVFNNINYQITNLLPNLPDAAQLNLLLSYENTLNAVAPRLYGNGWIQSSTKCGINGASGRAIQCGDAGTPYTAPTCPVAAAAAAGAPAAGVPAAGAPAAGAPAAGAPAPAPASAATPKSGDAAPAPAADEPKKD